MSTLTKKQQKAQSFRKGGKGKKQDTQPEDVPEHDLLDDHEDSPTIAIGATESPPDVNPDLKPDQTEDVKKKSKSKLSKEKKLREKQAKEVTTASKLSGQKTESLAKSSPGGPAAKNGKGKEKASSNSTEEDTKTEQQIGKLAGEEQKRTKKDIKQRFILFVGHLSYKTTSDEIAAHFARETGHTPSVRLLTHKSDPRAPEKAYLVGQSRGIAFVEFPSSLAIQAALKLHHTELGGNRINVELTAGGGGSTGERKKKIDERNQRVGEQRVKRKERESEGVEGEEQDEDIAAETQDGQPLKKKLKARGGRRGKADNDNTSTDLAGWAARKQGTFVSDSKRQDTPGGRGRGRGGRSATPSRRWEPTGSNAMVVG